MSNELSTCKDDTCCIPQQSTTTSTTDEIWVRPPYELDRNEEAFRVKVYVPGAAKSDVNISVDGGSLTVTASRSDRPNDDWKPIHRELSNNSYRLEVKLPDQVDVTKIGASVEDGILDLTLPIREADKPRNIEVV